MVKVKFASLFLGATLLVGCATTKEYSNPPTNEAELFTITQVETPTRLIGKSGWRSYVIDLAYFVPVLERCDTSTNLCAELESKTLNKELWVQREYDRYGVPMHTVWYSEPSKSQGVRQSINIELLMEGYSDAPADARNLPNGKSKLVGFAHESGREALRLERIKSQLPDWRLKNIEDADMIERGF